MPVFPIFSRIRVLKTILLATAVATYFLNPTAVAADFLKVTAPAEINLETAFEINLEISAQPNTTYLLKARLGNKTNQLSQGQTFNSQKNLWLSDTVSWNSFPSFTTDNNGMWVGNLGVRSIKNALLGDNFLVVRIHDPAGNNIDSATYTLKLNPAPAAIETVSPPPQPVVAANGQPTLNEFLPQPQGGGEWVEIKNSGKGTADISNWWVDDEPGKSSPQQIPAGTIIPAGGFYLVNFKSPKLNDLTDSVRLLNPDQTEVEAFRYDHTEKGNSWSKDSSGSWFISAVPTPAAENIDPPNLAPAPTPQQSPTLQSETANPELTSTPTNQPLPTVLGSNDNSKVSAAIKLQQPKNLSFMTTPVILLGLILVGLAGTFFLKRRFKDSLKGA